MPKFFAYKGQIENDSFFIDGEEAKHIINVLRSQVGDEIIICDGEGCDYYCTIKKIEKGSLWAEIDERVQAESEPDVKISLYQGIPKGDKMELIIQKAVEIGAVRIIPVKTEFAVAKLDGKEEKKCERWQKISLSAAKQCGRGVVPKVELPMTFKEAVEDSKKLDLQLIPYENERENTFRSVINSIDKKKTKSVAIFIGPEGGFSPKEIELALGSGVKSLTLGKRILRTETAGLVALSILLYEME